MFRSRLSSPSRHVTVDRVRNVSGLLLRSPSDLPIRCHFAAISASADLSVSRAHRRLGRENSRNGHAGMILCGRESRPTANHGHVKTLCKEFLNENDMTGPCRELVRRGETERLDETGDQSDPSGKRQRPVSLPTIRFDSNPLLLDRDAKSCRVRFGIRMKCAPGSFRR